MHVVKGVRCRLKKDNCTNKQLYILGLSMTARVLYICDNAVESLVRASSYWLAIYASMADDQITLTSQVLPNVQYNVFEENYLYYHVFKTNIACTTGSLQILKCACLNNGTTGHLCLATCL